MPELQKKQETSEPQEEEYFMTVTMTTGRYGRERPYQQTTFEQNFTSHEDQVRAMQKVFPAVGLAVGTEMTLIGDADIADGKLNS